MHFLEDDPLDSDTIERSLGACGSEPFVREHEGKRYCVLHFPGADKKEAFEIAVKRKLQEEQDESLKLFVLNHRSSRQQDEMRTYWTRKRGA